MTTKAQKDEALEYLVNRLEGSAEKVIPARKVLAGDNETRYVLVGDDGIVFSIDRTYTERDFLNILRTAREKKPKVAFVFYKDGKTFFRSAAQDNHFKTDDRSLKNYNNEDMNKMILVSPGEKIMSRGNCPWLQYYQPESARLSQGIVSYRFAPVHFDYSHIDRNQRFKPENRDSERLKIWTDRSENSGLLTLNDRLVVPRE